MPKTRVLCAHADQDGVGMHWRGEGEQCPLVVEDENATQPADNDATASERNDQP